MNRTSLPPLLRGIGTSTLLLATLLSVMAARKDIQEHPVVKWVSNQPISMEVAKRSPEVRALDELTYQTKELRSELEDATIVERVIDNRWFDWASLLGSAIIASSFFTEAFLRRRENG